MIVNRFAPPGRIVPRLVYRDVNKAIDWLCGALGFTERLRTAPEADGAIYRFGERQYTAEDLEGQRLTSAIPLSFKKSIRLEDPGSRERPSEFRGGEWFCERGLGARSRRF